MYINVCIYIYIYFYCAFKFSTPFPFHDLSNLYLLVATSLLKQLDATGDHYPQKKISQTHIPIHQEVHHYLPSDIFT